MTGDLLLDRWIDCGQKPLDPRLGIPVLQMSVPQVMAGGAATAARLLREYGFAVCVRGTVGEDAAATLLVDQLEASGICCAEVLSATGRTTQRTWVSLDGRAELRLDVDATPCEASTQDSYRHCQCCPSDPQLVLISHFGRSPLERHLPRPEDVSSATVVLAAKSAAARNACWSDFLVTGLFDHREYTHLLDAGTEGHLVERAAQELCTRIRSHGRHKVVIITAAEHGLFWFDAQGAASHREAGEVRVKSAVGAGDVLVATLCAQLVEGKEPHVAIEQGALAATAAVQCPGIALPSIRPSGRDNPSEARRTAAVRTQGSQ